MLKSILIFILMLAVVSCKRDKTAPAKKDDAPKVILIGRNTNNFIDSTVVWNANGKQINAIPGNHDVIKVYGIHLIPQDGKDPLLSFIGLAKSDAGPYYRVCILLNGEKKELATLAGLRLESNFGSELIMGFTKDGQGNSYVGCASSYVYKIDPKGNVTYSILEQGTLFFDNFGLKSMQVTNLSFGEFEFRTCDRNLKFETFTYVNTNLFRFFQKATCISATKIFFFVILMDQATKIQIDYLLTFNKDTRQFTLQEIGYPNELLNFKHSVINENILYVVGDDKMERPFYLAIDISDQSGLLKLTRTDFEATTPLRRATQILVADKNVYISAERESKTALWVNGKLIEVDNKGFNRSYVEILTSY